MLWNWQLPNWPQFVYDLNRISRQEKQFLLGVGGARAFLKNIAEQEYNQFVVEILSVEGLESSRIEGEILDRESLQSSIKQHFGLQTVRRHGANKELQMAKLLCHVYETFSQPLTHEMLWQWHFGLFDGHSSIADCGKYRTHLEPMQIISHRYDAPKVFFEAPPSVKVSDEMAIFVDWFNSPEASKSILGRAATAHFLGTTQPASREGLGKNVCRGSKRFQRRIKCGEIYRNYKSL
jgi:Fic family protein